MNLFSKIVGIVAACVVVFAEPAAASPAISATGTATYSDHLALSSYWKYCYEVTWSGLPHGVSHAQVVMGLPGECEHALSPNFFAFPDTVGSGPGTAEGEICMVYYYCTFEPFGDPSTGLDFMLLKFEPYEGDGEPDAEGSAHLCFYSKGVPIWGSFADCIGIKYAGESVLGQLDGALPGCNSGYSPTDASTWGHIKSLYR